MRKFNLRKQMELVVLLSSATSILAFGLAGCGNSSVEGRDNSAQVQSIKKYLANNFGIPELMASWYPNILGVLIKGDTVIVQTNLSSAKEKIEKDLNSLRTDYHKNEIDLIKEVEKAKLEAFETEKSNFDWLLEHNKISIQQFYKEQLALIEQVKKTKLDSIDEQIKAEENYSIQPAMGSLSALIASAEHICGGTSGFVFSNENTSAGLQNIQIVGANGEVLIERRGIEDTCSHIASTATSSASPREAAELPKFKKSESYNSVRAKMIKAGWKPFHSESADTCSEYDERCIGRPEMEACAGTGMANCKFLWLKKGKTVSICTVGEDTAFDGICDHGY